VVTVPAYFSDRQKFVTRAACDYAGIQCLRLLPEPTAAALSFGLETFTADDMRTIMVFDLGGGTFDISVLTVSGGSFMEVTKGGDMWLGGDNIDQLLVDYVFSSAEADNQCTSIRTLVEALSPAERARFRVEILEKAEAAKIQLSTESSASIELFGILKDEHRKLIDIDVTITRETFNTLIHPMIARVSKIAAQILEEIRFEPELIDTVLMVGGTSLIPALQEALKTQFGADKVQVHPRPLLAVAEGAALMAAKLISQPAAAEDFTLMHSTAQDYYLQLAQGKKHLLVARNTPLPVTVEEKLTFAQADQKLARLRIFNEIDGVMETVGELWVHKEHTLDYPPKALALMLRFSVDENNIIMLKVWPIEHPERVVETQIARGALTTKLYHDLEQTLASIMSEAEHHMAEKDALELSRIVVETILSATNHGTGEICAAQKLKAQQQIARLKEYQEHHLAPWSLHHFAAHSLDVAVSLMTAQEKSQLEVLVRDLKQAIDTLAEVKQIEALEDEITDFLDHRSAVSSVSRAIYIANRVDGTASNDASSIRNLVQQVFNAHASKNKHRLEYTVEALDHYIFATRDFDPTPTRHFDREVCL
jgi:molecular chaperone DnaK